jgi:hypothetical protein
MFTESKDFNIYTLTYFEKYNGTDEKVVVPDGVNIISTEAFKGNKSVKSVILPNTVTHIQPLAFFDCSSLEKIVLSDNLKYIHDGAFAYCSGLSQIILPNKLMTIGRNAFSNSGLTSIELADNIKIGNNAFECCSNLKEITISSTTTDMGLYTLGMEAFSDCKGLTKVCFSEGSQHVRHGLFKGCSNLSTVLIPNGAHHIEDFAFYLCDELKKIYIPSSVTNIGRSAFDRIDRKNKLTIQAPKGSYAIKYAKKNHFKYEYVEENPYVNG